MESKGKVLATGARSVGLDVREFVWRRGRVVQNPGDTLTIQLSEKYRPDDGPHIWLALVRVKSADDVIGFLKAFGPLKLQFLDGEPHGFVDVKETTQVIDDVIDVARELRDIARVLSWVRQAHDGDREALSQLREASRSARVRRLRKPHLLAKFEQWIAGALSERIGSCEMTVTPSGAGQLRFAVRPQNLEQYCFLTFARAAAAQAVIRICLACEGVFHTDDARQSFCGSRCATRVRVQRFRQGSRRQRVA